MPFLMKAKYLDAIFNEGKINQVYHTFPDKFKKDLSSYEMILTTNYDKNIESVTGKNVHYLHGAFHILSDLYNSESILNKVSEPALKAELIYAFIFECTYL